MEKKRQPPFGNVGKTKKMNNNNLKKKKKRYKN